MSKTNYNSKFPQGPGEFSSGVSDTKGSCESNCGHGGGGAKGGPGYELRPGDWPCCGMINYAWRKICRRCGASKPKDDSAAAKVTPVAAGGGAKGGPGYQRRDGDWACCGMINYASRNICRKCHAPKPDGAAAEVVAVAAGAAEMVEVVEVTPVASGGDVSGATPVNTWAARTSVYLPKVQQKLPPLEVNKQGPKSDSAIIEFISGNNRHGKPWWSTKVSDCGLFKKYQVKSVDSKYAHLCGADTVKIFLTPDGTYILLFMHEKKNDESLEEEKRAVSRLRKEIMRGVTNEEIKHRCCVHSLYGRDKSKVNNPEAFEYVAYVASEEDPSMWRFTTIVLTEELLKEYFDVVDGNIAARNEQMAIHNEHVERLSRLGAFQCPEFPSQVLLGELGPVPKGTIPKHIYDYIVKELPHLPGFRTGYDVVRYEDGRIIVVRLPNLDGSTPPLNQKWSAIVQDWYAENKDSIAQKILTDIRAYNRERRVKNAAEREERARYTGEVSFGAGTGKGSHRGKVFRTKQVNGMTGAPAKVAPAPTKTTQSAAVSDSDFERLISLLKRKWNADDKRFSDEEDTWRRRILLALTPSQKKTMQSLLR